MVQNSFCRKEKIMANNRLYVGDITNKKWVCISKGFAAGWRSMNAEAVKGMDELITSPYLCEETEIKGKTSLRFFTEYDDLYDEVVSEGSGWERVKI
jgi:hypothetical protein